MKPRGSAIYAALFFGGFLGVAYIFFSLDLDRGAAVPWASTPALNLLLAAGTVLFVAFVAALDATIFK